MVLYPILFYIAKEIPHMPNLPQTPLRRVVRIVLTGGAAAGKSCVLDTLADEISPHNTFMDFPIAIVPECATQLLSHGITPDRIGQTAFQHAVFRHQLQNENHAFRAMLPTAKKIGLPVVLLCDRGLCDGGAYIREETFTTICHSFDYSRKRLLNRYQAVLYLDSAATLPDLDFDVYAGNAHRLESSRAEVLTTADNAYAAWQDHPHLSHIPAEPDFAAKVENVRNTLCTILDNYR